MAERSSNEQTVEADRLHNIEHFVAVHPSRDFIATGANIETGSSLWSQAQHSLEVKTILSFLKSF